MFLRSLLIVFMVTAEAFADIVIVKDGTSYTGTIIKITNQSVVLRAGRQNLILERIAVTEIVFAKSDLVVLTSGDTLRGKVLSRNENGFVVALEEKLRVIETIGITTIVYLAGTSLRPQELVSTDDAFRFEHSPLKTRRSPIFASAYFGTHSVSYFFAGDLVVGPLSFQKSVPGQLYGVEGGLEIRHAITLTIGAYWHDAQTNILQSPGIIQPSRVGYSCAYVSGIYNFFPEGKLDLFFRIQLAVLRATSTFNTGDLKSSLVPVMGLKYMLSPPLQMFCEVGLQSANLPLNYNGDSIYMKGVFIIAGLRLYLVIVD